MKYLDLGQIAGGPECSQMDEWGNVLAGLPCPSQPRVQEAWVAAVARESEAGEWLELRGLGFRGNCFCAACQYGYGAAGGILEQLAREEALGGGHPAVNLMLIWRRSVQYGLLQQMRAVAAGRLCLRTAAELRYVGERSSLTFVEARGVVDACSVVCGTVEEVERLRRLERPLPVYLVREGSVEKLMDGIFAGYIE